MSERGRAGQHRGTSSTGRTAQTLEASATAALVQAEVLSGQAARGETASELQLHRFVRVARGLDREAVAFVRDLRLAPDDPEARETALVVDRVIAAIEVIRRTLDLVIEVRGRGGTGAPGGVDEPLLA